MMDLVEAARSFMDVPYKHQGRNPDIGLDCGGLVAASLSKIGIEYKDLSGYQPTPDHHKLRAILRDNFGAEVSRAPQPGDILLIRFRSEPQHLAILTEPGRFIHSYRSAGRVIEQTYSKAWQRRTVGVYSVR